MFVHTILHSTTPGDLPVAFPTKLVMVIDLKTAKERGLTIPLTVLFEADAVIQEACQLPDAFALAGHAKIVP
jgi:putative ABC transport system substrate-binding protein